MLRLRFAALALFTVSLAGCDVFEEIENPDPVALPIATLQFEGIPVAPNRTRDWDDDGTGPDVFIEIQNTAAVAIYSTEITPDVDLSQPFSIDVPGTVEAPSATARLFVNVYDSDGDRLTAESLGSSISFSAQELLDSNVGLTLEDINSANGRVSTYTLSL